MCARTWRHSRVPCIPVPLYTVSLIPFIIYTILYYFTEREQEKLIIKQE